MPQPNEQTDKSNPLLGVLKTIGFPVLLSAVVGYGVLQFKQGGDESERIRMKQDITEIRAVQTEIRAILEHNRDRYATKDEVTKFNEAQTQTLKNINAGVDILLRNRKD